ncbi:MAG: hypothetical protein K1X55_08320 [Chitinophagales bacterium]|nr:hypothetical protein [Chitinophagales bacterium]
MLESKLFKTYQSLSKEELRLFAQWLNSPIANSHNDVRLLFSFLDTRKTYNVLTLQKSRAFAFIYGKDITYNDLRMRHVMSLSTQVLEHFLAYSYFIHSRNDRQIALAKSLQQHQLLDQADAVLKKIKVAQNLQGKQDAHFYMETFQLEVERFELLKQNSREQTLNIQSISDAIHHHAVAEILKYACIAISHQNVTNQPYTFSLLPEIIALIEANQLPTSPAVEIYFFAYQTLTHPNENSYFSKLVETVYRYESKFTLHDLKDIFMLCINHCIKKLNSSELIFAKTAYKLYLHALDKKYLLENNELSRFTFTNIVFIGLKLNDFEGVETFIQENGKYLNDSMRANTISFNMARLYFTQKNYRKTMPILLSIEYSDTLWNLAAKFMLVKIYFETKEYEALVSLLNTFKVYLHRQKKMGYHKERYKKIIRFSEKLYLSIDASKSKKHLLKKEITEEHDLPDKEWFLGMLG